MQMEIVNGYGSGDTEWREFQAASHLAASANQNVTIDIPCEQVEDFTLCFPQKLKSLNLQNN